MVAQIGTRGRGGSWQRKGRLHGRGQTVAISRGCHRWRRQWRLWRQLPSGQSGTSRVHWQQRRTLSNSLLTYSRLHQHSCSSGGAVLTIGAGRRLFCLPGAWHVQLFHGPSGNSRRCTACSLTPSRHWQSGTPPATPTGEQSWHCQTRPRRQPCICCACPHGTAITEQL